MKRYAIASLTALIAAGLVAGCTTVRVVDRGEVDELVSPPAPEWAVRNAEVDPSGEYTYFVGISQEQTTSESDAVQQAYVDAMAQVADAIGATIQGHTSLASFSDSESEQDWPHRVRGRRNATSDWDREGEINESAEAEDTINRHQLLGEAQIIDTWVVRESFQNAPPRYNLMKYGELWKAKVLVRIQSDELRDRAEDYYEKMTREPEVEEDHLVVPRPTFSFIETDYVKQDLDAVRVKGKVRHYHSHDGPVRHRSDRRSGMSPQGAGD